MSEHDKIIESFGLHGDHYHKFRDSNGNVKHERNSKPIFEQAYMKLREQLVKHYGEKCIRTDRDVESRINITFYY